MVIGFFWQIHVVQLRNAPFVVLNETLVHPRDVYQVPLYTQCCPQLYGCTYIKQHPRICRWHHHWGKWEPCRWGVWTTTNYSTPVRPKIVLQIMRLQGGDHVSVYADGAKRRKSVIHMNYFSEDQCWSHNKSVGTKAARQACPLVLAEDFQHELKIIHHILNKKHGDYSGRVYYNLLSQLYFSGQQSSTRGDHYSTLSGVNLHSLRISGFRGSCGRVVRRFVL